MKYDPTARIASNNVQNDKDGDRRIEIRYKNLLTVLLTMCDLAQFEIEGSFTLRDRRSGNSWTTSKHGC